MTDPNGPHAPDPDYERGLLAAEAALEPSPRQEDETEPDRSESDSTTTTDDDICGVFAHEGRTWIGIPETMDPQQLRPGIVQEPPQNETRVARDVWVHNLTFMHSFVDHRVNSLGFDFVFQRNYRSGIVYDGILGLGWDHSYNIRVVPARPAGSQEVPGGWREEYGPGLNSGDLTYHHGTGRITAHPFLDWDILSALWHDAQFTAIVSTYQQNDGESFEIQRFAVLSGTVPPAVTGEGVFYRIRLSDGTRLLLNCHGYVVEIRDRNHNYMRFAYNGMLNPTTNYNVLSEIADTVGRKYELTYYNPSPAPRIKQVAENFGPAPVRAWQYQYDVNNQLQYVDLVPGSAGTPILRYRYAAGTPAGLLTEIVNPVEFAQTGVRQAYAWLKNEYVQVCLIATQRVGSDVGQTPAAGGTYTIRQISSTEVTVVDRVQTEWTYILQYRGNSNVVVEVHVTDSVYDGARGGPISKDLVTAYAYDAQFHIVQTAHPSGLKEHFAFETPNAMVTLGEEFDSLNPVYTHRNDLSRDNVTGNWIEPSQATLPATIETRYVHEHLFNRITEVHTPLGASIYKYQFTTISAPENNGNARTITHPQQVNPNEVLNVVDQFTYGPGGVVRQHVDPDNIVHDYVPYSGIQKGMVDAHLIGGQLFDHYVYDDFRRQTQYVDARKAVWSTAYDARDNVISVKDPLYRSVTTPAGVVEYHMTTCTYDLDDRQTGKTVAVGDDLNTNVIANATAISGTLTDTLGYDVLGQQVSRTQSGTLHAFTGTIGTVSDLTRTWEWHHDPESRVVLTRTPRATSGERPDAQLRLEYNRRGLASVRIEADDAGATSLPDKNPGTTTWLYDADGRPALETDPMLRTTTRRYDGYGRVITEQYAGMLKITSQYDDGRPVLKYRWSEGDIRSFPTVVSGTDQQILGSAPTTHGLLLDGAEFTIDQSERVTILARKTFAIDQQNPVPDPVNSVLRPSPSYATKIWYTAAGRTKKVADPAGRETTYTYDPQGRPWVTTLPGGHTVVYGYEGPLVTSITSTFLPPADYTPLPGLVARRALVVREIIEYDLLRRRVMAASQGTTTRYAYDTLGNVRTKQHALGRTEVVYDALARSQRERVFNVDPTNLAATLVNRYDYDLNDNRTMMVTGGGTTNARYDGREMLVRLESPDQPPLQIVRRADGQPDHIERGQYRTVRYSYDDGGRVVEIQYQSGRSSLLQLFGYDGLGQLWWCLDNNRDPKSGAVLVRRTYDSLQRQTNEKSYLDLTGYLFSIDTSYQTGQLSDAKTVSWVDFAVAGTIPNRSVTSETGADGTLRRITSRTQASPRSVTWLERRSQGTGRIVENRHYLEAGTDQIELLVGHEYQGEGLLYRRGTYLLDRLFSTLPASGRVTNPSTQLLPLGSSEFFAYGDHGMVREHRLPVLLPSPSIYVPPPSSLSAKVLEALAWTASMTPFVGAALVINTPLIEASQRGVPEIISTYKYDGAGRLYQTVDRIAIDTQTITRAWDLANRPLSITSDRGQEHDVGNFGYGFAGTQLQSRTDSWTKNSVRAGQGTWSFDRFGRLDSYRDTNAAARLTKEYAYDPADRVDRIWTNDPAVTPSRGSERYKYDALNRLVYKETDAHASVHYNYDGDRCVSEINSGGAALVPSRHYIYDDAGRIIGFAQGSAEYLSVSTYDGGLWLVFNRTGVAPPPAPANPMPLERLDYYLYALRLLIESHGTGPFENPLTPSLGLDYATGQPVAKPLTTSDLAASTGDYIAEVLPLGTGGQRNLLAGTYNHGAFHDPLLGMYFVPDAQGAWANPTGFGNAAAYAANNPVLINRTLQGQSGLDAGLVAESAGAVALDAGVMTLCSVGAIALLGPAAAPLMLGLAIYQAAQAWNNVIGQIESGAELPESNFRLVVSGLGATLTDALGVRGLFEGISGRDMVTAQELDTETRSRVLGEGLVNAAILARDFAGGLGNGTKAVKSTPPVALNKTGLPAETVFFRFEHLRDLQFPVAADVGMRPMWKFSVDPEGYAYLTLGVVGVRRSAVEAGVKAAIEESGVANVRNVIHKVAAESLELFNRDAIRGTGFERHEVPSARDHPLDLVRAEIVHRKVHRLGRRYSQMHMRDPATGKIVGGTHQVKSWLRRRGVRGRLR